MTNHAEQKKRSDSNFRIRRRWPISLDISYEKNTFHPHLLISLFAVLYFQYSCLAKPFDKFYSPPLFFLIYYLVHNSALISFVSVWSSFSAVPERYMFSYVRNLCCSPHFFCRTYPAGITHPEPFEKLFNLLIRCCMPRIVFE